MLSQHASLIICADGGADRLRQLTVNPSNSLRLPDAVVGDLDSVTDSTLAEYKSQGVQILRDPDQYSTDFTKALRYIRSKAGGSSHEDDVSGAKMDIVAFGGLGGRVDQAFSQIHHLFAAMRKPEWLKGDIYLVGEESMSLVLEEGKSTIKCGPMAPEEDRLFDENVGIIPVMGLSCITTKGLEWDVENWPTEFGGQVSTSNHLRADIIEIQTSERVLFTLEFSRQFNTKQ